MKRGKDASLIFALLLMGFTGVVAQILLIRELIVTFSGNEFSLGLIFFNWLAMVAIGSFVLRKFVGRMGRVHLAMIQVIIAMVLPVQVLLVRIAKNLMDIELGVVVGIVPIFYCSLIVLAPLCILLGSQFVVGCKVYSKDGKASSIGGVYVSEALGAVVGGITFAYFLVYHTHSFEIAVYLASLNLLSALFVLYPCRRIILSGMIILLLGLNAYALSSRAVDGLNELSIRWRWSGYNLVRHQDSTYGNVAATKSDNQFNFFVNGLFMFSAPDPDVAFVEEMVHFPLLLHPSPSRVLIIGGGVGGPLDEVLKHPVDEVHYTELDPLIISVYRKFTPTSTLDDPRVQVQYVDGRFFVKNVKVKFDVVIVNLPPPSTLQLNRFYTQDFFQEIRSILNEDGVFSIWVSSSEAYMSKEMRNRNDCIYATVKSVFPFSIAIQGDYTFYLSSATKISYDVDVLTKRLRQRALETRLLNEHYITYKQDRIVSTVDMPQDRIRVNKDFEPIGSYYDIVLWNVMYYPESRTVFDRVSRETLWLVILGLSALLVSISVRRREGLGKTPILAAIITTGIAGMTFNIILIFAFQASYGYVYQAIAILTASFQVGLSLGALSMNRLIDRVRRRVSVLATIQLIICAFSLTILITLTTFSWGPHILTEVGFLTLNTLAGVFVGLEFPLACRIYLDDKGGQVDRVAGTIYASDLCGACLGTALAGVFLIPVLGIQQTCIGLIVLNMTSLLLLLGMRRSSL